MTTTIVLRHSVNVNALYHNIDALIHNIILLDIKQKYKQRVYTIDLVTTTMTLDL